MFVVLLANNNPESPINKGIAEIKKQIIMKPLKKIKQELKEKGESQINEFASVTELRCTITGGIFYEVLHDGESTGIISEEINDVKELIKEYKESSY